jgi:stalled ribosome alternative rescue factor ArfA
MKIMKKAEVIDKRVFKKSPEELALYLHFRKRSFKIANKKGKGSYERKSKHATSSCI